MKGIVGNIMLVALPFVLFVVCFYLTSKSLEREIEVSHISAKITNFLNEVEIYKPLVNEKVKNEKKDFFIEGKYARIKVEIREISNEINFDVVAEPIEKIEGLEIKTHYIGKVKL